MRGAQTKPRRLLVQSEPKGRNRRTMIAPDAMSNQVHPFFQAVYSTSALSASVASKRTNLNTNIVILPVLPNVRFHKDPVGCATSSRGGSYEVKAARSFRNGFDVMNSCSAREDTERAAT